MNGILERQKSTIIDLIDTGLNFRQIAEYVGCSRMAVSKFAKRHYSPALLDLFERLGFGREQRADAVRVAASELIWEGE